MIYRSLPLVFAMSLATSIALAASPSPYAGEEQRDIRALAPAHVDSLLAGKGMGYAKAAELNGYPGPAHVLELAEELSLTEVQKTATQQIFAAMESKAQRLGAKLVEAERMLDQDFRQRRVTQESLQRSLARIASLQGQLRQAHLEAHLLQTALLEDQQVALYARLRGYGGAGGGGGDDHSHHD